MSDVTKKYIWVGFLLCFLWLPVGAQAQFDSPFMQRMDSLLIKMQRTNTDTNYIVRPRARLTLKLLFNLSGANMFARKNYKEKNSVSAHVDSQLKRTIAASVNYRGLALSMSFNPAHFFNLYHDFEINLNSYGNKFGADFIYQRSSSFSGRMNAGGETTHIESGKVKQRSVDANFYYVFNNKRFSFPAAFTQNYIQKRSVGSWMVGASYLGLDTNMGLTDGEIQNLIKAKMLGVGAGYGYNWVFHRRWLLHFSTLPTLVVWQNTNFDDDVEKNSNPFYIPNVLITGRIAAIHYFENKFFGVTIVMNHNHLGQHMEHAMDFFKWRTRFLVGVRF